MTTYFQTIHEYCTEKQISDEPKEDAKHPEKEMLSMEEFYSFSQENQSYLNEVISKLKADQSQSPVGNPWKFETPVVAENSTDIKGEDTSLKKDVDVKDISVIEVDSSGESSMVIGDNETVEMPAKKLKIEALPTNSQVSSSLTENMQVKHL